MSSAAPVPIEIRRLGTQAVRISWKDGHVSEYDNYYLRDHCPCAACRERPARALPVVESQRHPLYAATISHVGRYAVGIEWSDGHDSGIFSYVTLRALCPCPRCAPVSVTETER